MGKRIRTLANGDVVVENDAMTEEQELIGSDLSDHAVIKIREAITDFVQLSDHPAQLYKLQVRVISLMMHGFAMFDLEKYHDSGSSNNSMDRIIKSSMLTLIQVLGDHGSKECTKALRNDTFLGRDWRYMALWLSKINTYEVKDD